MHIMEIPEGLFQKMTFMVSYEEEIRINQTKDLGNEHAKKRKRE